jgi:hypothetical protein
MFFVVSMIFSDNHNPVFLSYSMLSNAFAVMLGIGRRRCHIFACTSNPLGIRPDFRDLEVSVFESQGRLLPILRGQFLIWAITPPERKTSPDFQWATISRP